MSKAELVIEEGFAVARCYEEKCDFDHASREKVRKHVKETGHVVEFTRSTRAVYKRTG